MVQWREQVNKRCKRIKSLVINNRFINNRSAAGRANDRAGAAPPARLSYSKWPPGAP